MNINAEILKDTILTFFQQLRKKMVHSDQPWFSQVGETDSALEIYLVINRLKRLNKQKTLSFQEIIDFNTHSYKND